MTTTPRVQPDLVGDTGNEEVELAMNMCLFQLVDDQLVYVAGHAICNARESSR